MKKSLSDKYVKRMEELITTFMKGTLIGSSTNLKALDVTPPQLMVLKALMERDNLTMTELSDAMNVTLGNMTGMIDRLIRDGYVKRVSDPRDRRIVRVNITQKAVEKVSSFMEHRAKGMKRMFENLSEEEINALFVILEKIADGIKKRTIGNK